MAAATAEITIDSPIDEVVAILGALSYIHTGEPQEFDSGDSPAWYMTSSDGGRMTVAHDLKLTEDGSETWVEVFEQTDKGLAERIFRFLSETLKCKVSFFSEGEGEPA